MPARKKESNEFSVKDSGTHQRFGTGAKRDSSEGKSRPDLLSPFALERIGYHMAKGALKYEPNNWHKGMPFSRYIESLERHLMQFKQGDRDEDHLAAIIFNAQAIMHHEAVGPAGLDDLPFYERIDIDQEDDE